MKPTTACVINFNGETQLSATLAALAASQPPLAEILVVDNASTDSSVELTRARFPNVRIVPIAENHGPGVARNVGLAAATNDRILFVDNDVRVRPGAAELLSLALDAAPRAVAAAPRVLFEGRPDTIQYEGANAHYLGLQALRHGERPDAETPAQTTVTSSIVTACFLLDRQRWGTSPAFDETFFFNYEDHDFGLRARIAGHDVLAVGGARVVHGSGTPDLSHRPGREFSRTRVACLMRNRWQILAKNYALRSLILFAPMLVLYELFQMIGAARRGWLGVWGESLGWIVRHRRSLKERRARVQAGRKVADRDILVDGPLPFTSDLARTAAERAARAMLDDSAQAYWAVARRLL